MEEEFIRLDTFLDFHLKEGDGGFDLDILKLVNLIDSNFPTLSWEIEDWEEVLEETTPPLKSIILLLDNDEFREIKFGGVDLKELGFLLDSPKIYSANTGDNISDSFKRACIEGKIKIVKYLYSLGCDLTSFDRITAQLVIQNGHLEVFKFLNSVGYDLSSFDNMPIIWASESGQLEMVKYFYSVCVPKALDNTRKYGRLEVVSYYPSVASDIAVVINWAITMASENGHLEVVKYLYEEVGCDSTYINNYAIKFASLNGHLEVVKYLCEKPDCNPRDWDNRAIQLASQYGHLEVVKYLCEEAGCNPMDWDNRAIRWASSHGHLEVVKYLYEEAGCNPTVWNNWAIKQASENGHLEVVEYLKSIGCQL